MENAPTVDWRLDLALRVAPSDVNKLTRRIASGDPEAFSRLFRTRFDGMLAEARRATGRDEAFCHDVVQDAMLRVIRNMKPIDTEAGLVAWLRTVVQSCAYDRLRRDSRRNRRERNASTAVPRAEADREATAERLAWLETQLQTLDHRSVEILLMRHRFGWTLQEIGRALGLSPGAVDGRLRRLVRTLRRTKDHPS